MPQHDFEITTEDANSGPDMRAAINEALQALASNSSGLTEPDTTHAGMWWFDTTLGVLKQRNATDTAWIEWGPGMNENLLINPEGLFNQEGYVDGAATAEKEHIFDMWGVDRTGTGNCLKVTRLNKTIQLDNNVTGAASAWLQQENDDIGAVLDGNNLTISGEVTAIAGGNFAINGLGCNLSLPSTGPFVITFAKDTSDTDIYDTPFLKLVVDAGQSVTFKSLKLEEGSVATVYNSPKIGANESACLRYFEKQYPKRSHVFGHGYCDSTGSVTGILRYVPKRKDLPLIGTSGIFIIHTPGSTTDTTFAFPGGGDADRVTWSMLGSGYTVGAGAILASSVPDSYSAYITIDARYSI